MKLIVATQNPHKVKEIKALLWNLDINILSLSDLSQKISPQETGDSFEENAKQKARSVAAYMQEVVVLADDSGIQVEALGGEPGVFSARYSGPKATDKQNLQKLLYAMENVPWEKRQASYRCVMVLIDLEKRCHICEGICRGFIAFEPSGSNGFGYDPIFYVPEYKQTMAQLSSEIKNKISHRAKAMEKVKEILKQLTV